MTSDEPKAKPSMPPKPDVSDLHGRVEFDWNGEDWVKVKRHSAIYWKLKAIWMRTLCRIVGHDWDEVTLTNLDGTPAHFRCCLRCEKTEVQHG